METTDRLAEVNKKTTSSMVRRRPWMPLQAIEMFSGYSSRREIKDSRTLKICTHGMEKVCMLQNKAFLMPLLVTIKYDF